MFISIPADRVMRPFLASPQTKAVFGEYDVSNFERWNALAPQCGHVITAEIPGEVFGESVGCPKFPGAHDSMREKDLKRVLSGGGSEGEEEEVLAAAGTKGSGWTPKAGERSWDYGRSRKRQGVRGEVFGPAGADTLRERLGRVKKKQQSGAIGALGGIDGDPLGIEDDYPAF